MQLQAVAVSGVAKPVIASPVGLNAKILALARLGYGPTTEGERHVALRTACKQIRSLCYRLGQAGQGVALRGWIGGSCEKAGRLPSRVCVCATADV